MTSCDAVEAKDCCGFCDPMITATQHLEASPKPSYGPHKGNERYLDDEDRDQMAALKLALSKDRYRTAMTDQGATVAEFLQALETLRTHLRKKYYAG